MGPPSYMQSVVDRNVVMRRMTVLVMICVLLRTYVDLCCSTASTAVQGVSV